MMTYEYGNVTNNGSIGFTYDWANQPTATSGTGGSGSYVYDGNLKRAKQIVGGKTIYSVYSASGALIHRDDVTSNLKTDYVRAAGKTIARVKGNTVSYVHQDHLGSPVASTTAAGTIAWREDFTPYGEKRVDPNGNKDDEGFTGHIDAAATGLTYMQARYYDPVIGRFLSNGPVGFAEGGSAYFNRYAYTVNNPVNAIDPDGQKCSPTNGGYVCGIDNNRDKNGNQIFTTAEVARVNKAYTEAVNRLVKDCNKHHTIKVGGKPLKVKAGDIADGLIDATVSTSNEPGRASLGGGELSPSKAAADGGGNLIIKRKAITLDRSEGTKFIDRDLVKTFIHEGIHTVPGEGVFKQLHIQGKFQGLHQTPYNNASTLFYHNSQY